MLFCWRQCIIRVPNANARCKIFRRLFLMIYHSTRDEKLTASSDPRGAAGHRPGRRPVYLRPGEAGLRLAGALWKRTHWPWRRTFSTRCCRTFTDMPDTGAGQLRRKIRHRRPDAAGAGGRTGTCWSCTTGPPPPSRTWPCRCCPSCIGAAAKAGGHAGRCGDPDRHLRRHRQGGSGGLPRRARDADHRILSRRRRVRRCSRHRW